MFSRSISYNWAVPELCHYCIQFPLAGWFNNKHNRLAHTVTVGLPNTVAAPQQVPPQYAQHTPYIGCDLQIRPWHGSGSHRGVWYQFRSVPDSPCGICGGRSVTGTGYCPNNSVFPYHYNSTKAQHSSTCSCFCHRKDRRAKPGKIQTSLGNREDYIGRCCKLFVVFRGMGIFRALQWPSSCYIYVPICTEPYINNKLNFCAEVVILSVSDLPQWYVLQLTLVLFVIITYCNSVFTWWQ